MDQNKEYTTLEEILAELSKIKLTRQEFKEWIKPRNESISIEDVVNEKNQDIIDLISSQYD